MKIEMNWFERVVEFDRLHDKFKFLLDPQYVAERGLLSQWITTFLSKDGIAKSLKEFQTTFHSVFWEIYLSKLFSDSGWRDDARLPSPDFCLTVDNRTIFVEAVTANIAISGRLERDRSIDDVYGTADYKTVILESIVRLCNSIDQKSKMYIKTYSKNEQIRNSPFVIAVADYAQVNYGHTHYFSPLACLYNAFYDQDDHEDLKILCDDSFGREYKFLAHIPKNNSLLQLGVFASARNSHISALIYSCTLSLGKLTSLCSDHAPIKKVIRIDWETYVDEEIGIIRLSGSEPDETVGDGVYVFHNPYAERPLPEDFLQQPGITHVFFREKDSLIDIRTSGHALLRRRYVAPALTAAIDIPGYNEAIWFRGLKRNTGGQG